MRMKDLVRNNRSFRRFYEEVAVDLDTLKQFVDLARLSASGSNRQPLKYILSADPETNALIFPSLKWAHLINDWPGPSEGERPSAYIIMLLDTRIRKSVRYDPGIAAQSILMGATEIGLGGCIVGSIRRNSGPVREAFKIPPHLEVIFAIALGKPRENVIIDVLEPGGDTKYWRDDEGNHHVPKRALVDIIFR